MQTRSPHNHLTRLINNKYKQNFTIPHLPEEQDLRPYKSSQYPAGSPQKEPDYVK